MYDLETIKSMNQKAARAAKRSGVTPYVVREGDADNWPPFPFPNIGDYDPPGWELVERYFVDSSGFGRNDEPAMTAAQFRNVLKPGRGYAVVSAGQFQVYVGEFKRTHKEV